ncbi:hypothetical protein ERJ75_001316700 [Trypanosoma vivax]|nr:hypothetical protein ERJ75_001316700 [Trypanosoma vivax]
MRRFIRAVGGTLDKAGQDGREICGTTCGVGKEDERLRPLRLAGVADGEATRRWWGSDEAAWLWGGLEWVARVYYAGLFWDDSLDKVMAIGFVFASGALHGGRCEAWRRDAKGGRKQGARWGESANERARIERRECDGYVRNVPLSCNEETKEG